MLDTLERVDTRVEIVVDWDAEPKCESEHRMSTAPCSTKAEYVVVSTCDHVSVLWCANRYREYQRTANSRLHLNCDRMLNDCWKVREL